MEVNGLDWNPFTGCFKTLWRMEYQRTVIFIHDKQPTQSLNTSTKLPCD